VCLTLRYFVSNDGTSNWLMGVQLIMTYLLIAIVYFFRSS
jgi:Ca2+/H+ antiporter